MRGERGSFLVQALVLVVLLALISSATVQFTLGRATVVGRVSSTEDLRSLGQSAESLLLACLEGTGLDQGPAGCSQVALEAALSACKFPKTLGPDARPVSVRVARSSPSCQLQVQVLDP